MGELAADFLSQGGPPFNKYTPPHSTEANQHVGDQSNFPATLSSR